MKRKRKNEPQVPVSSSSEVRWADLMASKSSKKHQLREAPVESKLLQRGPFDAKDDLENSLLQCYLNLQSQLTPPYQPPSQNTADMTVLNRALIYAILTQPRTSQSLFKHLAAITTDGYALFVSILIQLVNESYPKLYDHSRIQLLWLVRQLISFSAANVDNLCLCLLRRIVGGNLSQLNLWLSIQMLDTLRSNFGWMVSNPGLLTTTLFTYLRLLPDHFMTKDPALHDLRQGEVSLCVKILREHFQDCLVIGRDLVRLLQDVAFIPEFKSIWIDLLSNPSAFHLPEFSDIKQLYTVRTPSRYITSRLTPEMEAQIRFLLTFVRMGNQRRYQSWFAQRFLSMQGSETLVCDLIRFICCAHHPSNQILQSDIVPRWAVVGWLLQCCKSHHVEANAKLALFYDWLFFTTKTDNIMNIEPAILLMVHSIPKYMDITHSLLEFLFLCIDNYDPFRKDLILHGVTASINILVCKGVVGSLEPLSSSPYVASWLRQKITTYFPTYCKAHTFKVAKHAPCESVTNSVPSVKKGSSFGSEKEFPSKTNDVQGLDEIVIAEEKQTIVGPKSANQSDYDNSAQPPSSKKRRVEVVTVEDLLEALTRSQHEAVSVLEKLLESIISAADSKSRTSNETGSTLLANRDEGKIVYFTCQLSDILKEIGHGLFMPVSGFSLDCLEADEVNSLTSAVLRMYLRSQHPLLLKMLLSWEKKGLAVGARILCYVSRLVEDLDALTASVPPSCSGQQDAHAGAGIGVTTCLSSRSQAFLQQRTAASALSWHLGLEEVSDEKSGETIVIDSEVKGNILACCHSTLRDSFKAYKGYLKSISELLLHPSQGINCTEAGNSGECNQSSGTICLAAQVESEDELVMVLLKDLETCLTWNVNRLLGVLPVAFSHLPELARGREQMLKLLVSVLDPLELFKFECKLSLKEVSVFGQDLVSISKLLERSLKWDCYEQQAFWRLLIAELQAVAPIFAADFVKACAVSLKPSLHFDAISGLLLFLKLQWPTPYLVMIMLFLPQDFGRLVAAVFETWLSLDVKKLSACLNTLILSNLEVCDKLDQKFLSDKKTSVVFSNMSNLLEGLLKARSWMDEAEKVEALQVKQMLLDVCRRAKNLNKE